MVRYFILIKRKGAKRFLGAIAGRKGISKDRLRTSARSQIRRGFQFKVVSETMLKKILLKRAKKTRKTKRRTTKKKPKRRMTRKKTRKRKR